MPGIEGNVYRHKKRETLYRVLAESQTKLNGEWKDSVTYVCMMTGKVYNRFTEDFLDGKFELIREKTCTRNS